MATIGSQEVLEALEKYRAYCVSLNKRHLEKHVYFLETVSDPEDMDMSNEEDRAEVHELKMDFLERLSGGNFEQEGITQPSELLPKLDTLARKFGLDGTPGDMDPSCGGRGCRFTFRQSRTACAERASPKSATRSVFPPSSGPWYKMQPGFAVPGCGHTWK
jgi:hypothetical protein